MRVKWVDCVEEKKNKLIAVPLVSALAVWRWVIRKPQLCIRYGIIILNSVTVFLLLSLFLLSILFQKKRIKCVLYDIRMNNNNAKFMCIFTSFPFDSSENEYLFMVSDENKYGWDVDGDVETETPIHRLFIRDNAFVYFFAGDTRNKKYINTGEKKILNRIESSCFTLQLESVVLGERVFYGLFGSVKLRNYRRYQFWV